MTASSGVGKSHAAQALGHIACRKGYDVTYERTSVLLDWVHAGRGDATYQRRLRKVGSVALLVLDDFGLKPLPEHQQQDLYEVICNRYERHATVITSNRDFNEWPQVFANPLMASAAMDRLVHRAVKIVMQGKSYRMDSFVRRSRELPEPPVEPGRSRFSSRQGGVWIPLPSVDGPLSASSRAMFSRAGRIATRRPSTQVNHCLWSLMRARGQFSLTAVQPL